MKFDIIHPRPKVTVALSVRDVYIINMYIDYMLEKLREKDVSNHPWLEFTKDERKVAVDFNYGLADIVEEFPEYS